MMFMRDSCKHNSMQKSIMMTIIVIWSSTLATGSGCESSIVQHNHFFREQKGNLAQGSQDHIRYLKRWWCCLQAQASGWCTHRWRVSRRSAKAVRRRATIHGTSSTSTATWASTSCSRTRPPLPTSPQCLACSHQMDRPSEADATGEQVDSFRSAHPSFQLEDELFPEGGRDVSRQTKLAVTVWQNACDKEKIMC